MVNRRQIYMFPQVAITRKEWEAMGSANDEGEIEKSPWRGYFSNASVEDLKELNSICDLRQFRDGQTVYLNEPGNEGFYYIHSGYVKVICSKRGELSVVRIAGANDLVGFARWFSPIGRYGMVALSEVTASYFRKEDFVRLQERSAYIANEVIRWLVDVLTYQESRIYSLTGRPARERVASALIDLYKRFGKSIGGSNCLKSVPVDRKTLADLSGVALEVLSRILGELESESVIKRQGRLIVVTDAKGLEMAAGG